MPRFLIAGPALIAAMFVAPGRAAADFPGTGQVYDTVDGIQSNAGQITVTGIVSGQSTPTTSTYTIAKATNEDDVARCDRYALLAMAKPGKYQFSTVLGVGGFGCRLIVRTP